MSAFFLAINRDKSIFEQHIAEDMMSALDDFGHDQSQLVVKGYYALGYQTLWTVPEELGEQQPLFCDQTDTWFMFYGRIDNRSEVFEKLNLIDDAQSDASLMMRYYQSFGESELALIVGPFVFVAYDLNTSKVFAARDGMGGRNLVYRITNKHILIATYEMALVAHPSVEYRFNHARIARVIARLIEDVLSSPIAGLTPLEPGQMICVERSPGSQPSSGYFYQFDGSTRVVLSDDEAYAEKLKALLKQAVERRARTIGPVGTMLSGGFDSVPMSILLAQALEKQQQTLNAFSWVFDVHSSADERLYSNDICQRFNIEQDCINCDTLWPKFDRSTYVNPVMPFSIPYAELQQAALSAANKKGIRTVLSGVHGDLLYNYTDSIVWELFKSWRWKDGLIEALHRLKSSSSVMPWFKQYFLRPLPFVARYLEKRRLKSKPVNELLTKEMLALLDNSPAKTDKQAIKSLRPIGYKLIFGGFAGEDIAYGRHIDAQFNVERRYPFRDRDLCEFMLSIPSEQLNFKSVTRPIIRRAFENELSTQMLARQSKTSFYPAIKAGIENDAEYRKWFDKPNANWQFYVKKCYFDEQIDKKAGLDVVRWQCGYYDYWMSVCYNEKVRESGLDNEYS